MRLALVLALAACTLPLDPLGEPFTPPPVYAAWWQEVEDCTQWSADYVRIQFYQYHEECIPWPTEGCARATVNGYTVTFAAGAERVEYHVKHEFQHVLGMRHDHETWHRCLPGGLHQ